MFMYWPKCRCAHLLSIIPTCTQPIMRCQIIKPLFSAYVEEEVHYETIILTSKDSEHISELAAQIHKSFTQEQVLGLSDMLSQLEDKNKHLYVNLGKCYVLKTLHETISAKH